MSDHIHAYSNGYCTCGDHIVTQGPRTMGAEASMLADR